MTLSYAKFRVKPRGLKMTYPLLERYQEVTRQERVALYRELHEHRLNLLFQYGVQDNHLKSLAEYSVNDFYSLLYGMTHH